MTRLSIFLTGQQSLSNWTCPKTNIKTIMIIGKRNETHELAFSAICLSLCRASRHVVSRRVALCPLSCQDVTRCFLSFDLSVDLTVRLVWFRDTLVTAVLYT